MRQVFFYTACFILQYNYEYSDHNINYGDSILCTDSIFPILTILDCDYITNILMPHTQLHNM